MLLWRPTFTATVGRAAFRAYYTVSPRPRDPTPELSKGTTHLPKLQIQPVVNQDALAHGHSIAHPEKGRSEDAYVTCPEKQFFGVADGVGGWTNVGIDSGEYSQSLLHHINEYMTNTPTSTLYEALVHAHTQNQESGTSGSSTVVLAKMQGRELHGLNLGDSGMAIFRGNEMIYKSPEQSHSFNYPYQLGIGGDSPAKAHCIQCTLRKDDLVVLASDGLFDNLFPCEMEDVINNSLPQEVAVNLATTAMSTACSESKDTPFGERVAEETDQIWQGGKMDDITVVAHRVA